MGWRRRVWLALVAIIALAVAAWGGYRLTADPPRAETTLLPSATESMPDGRIDPSPDEPANVDARRAVGNWAHVLEVLPERLPAPSGDPVDSRDGAADCAPPGRASRAAGGRDAKETRVSLYVEPKSFQEVTITNVRVRVLSARPVSKGPRFVYQCVSPRGSSSAPVEFLVFADQGDVHDAARDQLLSLPQTVSAQSAAVWTANVTVVALGKLYEWQIEVDYSARGQLYTKTLKSDSAGNPLVTEAAQRADDFTDTFQWCASPGPPQFRRGERC